MRLTPVEEGYRVRIPADWAAELGLDQMVTVEKMSGGVLVSRYQDTLSWDEIFREKLAVGTADEVNESGELTGDDLLF